MRKTTWTMVTLALATGGGPAVAQMWMEQPAPAAPASPAPTEAAGAEDAAPPTSGEGGDTPAGLSAADIDRMSPDERRAWEATLVPADPMEEARAFDLDGDGRTDAWSRDGQDQPDVWDRNGDGKPDAWDEDYDGRADSFDTNGDGRIDGWDRDFDGKPDLFDRNGDGKPDLPEYDD